MFDSLFNEFWLLGTNVWVSLPNMIGSSSDLSEPLCYFVVGTLAMILISLPFVIAIKLINLVCGGISK